MFAWMLKRSGEPRARRYFHAIGWTLTNTPNAKALTDSQWAQLRDVQCTAYVYNVQVEDVVALIMEVLHPSSQTKSNG